MNFHFKEQNLKEILEKFNESGKEKKQNFRIHFVFIGSEIGLLHDFLGLENYESLFLGRIYSKITVTPFTRGFNEVNLKVRREDGN